MQLHTSHSKDKVESVQAGFNELMRAHGISGYGTEMGGPRPKAMHVPHILLAVGIGDGGLGYVMRCITRTHKVVSGLRFGSKRYRAVKRAEAAESLAMARETRRATRIAKAAEERGMTVQEFERFTEWQRKRNAWIDAHAKDEAGENARRAAAFEAERSRSWEKQRGLV